MAAPSIPRTAEEFRALWPTDRFNVLLDEFVRFASAAPGSFRNEEVPGLPRRVWGKRITQDDFARFMRKSPSDQEDEFFTRAIFSSSLVRRPELGLTCLEYLSACYVLFDAAAAHKVAWLASLSPEGRRVAPDALLQRVVSTVAAQHPPENPPGPLDIVGLVDMLVEQVTRDPAGAQEVQLQLRVDRADSGSSSSTSGDAVSGPTDDEPLASSLETLVRLCRGAAAYWASNGDGLLSVFYTESSEPAAPPSRQRKQKPGAEQPFRLPMGMELAAVAVTAAAVSSTQSAGSGVSSPRPDEQGDAGRKPKRRSPLFSDEDDEASESELGPSANESERRRRRGRAAFRENLWARPAEGATLLKWLSAPSHFQSVFVRFCTPEGRVELDGLRRMAAELKVGQSEWIQSRVIELYSSRIHPNSMSSGDMLALVRLMALGTRRQRLQWFFLVADVDDRKTVTRQQMEHVARELDLGRLAAASPRHGAAPSDGALFAAVDAVFSDLEATGAPGPYKFSALMSAVRRWEVRVDVMRGVAQLLGPDPFGSAGWDLVLPAPHPSGATSAPSSGLSVRPAEDAAKKPADGPRGADGAESVPMILTVLLIGSQMGYFFVTTFAGLLADSLLRHYGVSLSLLGLIGSINYTGYVVGMISTQKMIGRFGTGGAGMLNSCLAATAGFIWVISVQTHNFYLLLLGSFIGGTADMYLLMSLKLQEYYPHKMSTVFGVANGLLTGAEVCTAAVLPSLNNISFQVAMGYCQAAYFFSAACGLSFMLLERVLRPPGSAGADARPKVASVAHLHQVATGFRSLAPMIPRSQPIFSRESLRHPRSYWMLALGTCIAYSLVVVVFVLFPRFLIAEYGMSARTAGLVMVGFAKVVGVMTTAPLGAYFDRHGNRTWAATITMCMLATAILLFRWVHHPVVPFVVAACTGLSGAAVRGYGVPSVRLLLPTQAAAMGVTHFLLCWGTLIVSVSTAMGLLLGASGYDVVFPVMAAIAIGVATNFTALRRLDWALTRGKLDARPAAKYSARSLPVIRWKRAAKLSPDELNSDKLGAAGASSEVPRAASPAPALQAANSSVRLLPRLARASSAFR